MLESMVIKLLDVKCYAFLSIILGSYSDKYLLMSKVVFEHILLMIWRVILRVSN
jgi:hypothetical protein